MQPYKRTLHEFICKTDGFFKIPDFQRPYTWDGHQTDTFLSDLEKVAEKNNTHYFGTIVFKKENDYSVIIDGQQRLTSSLLFMNAVYQVLKKFPQKSATFDAARVKEHYLVNSYSTNVQDREKITLRTVTTDNAVLEKIFGDEKLDSNEQASKLFKVHIKFKQFLESIDNVDPFIDALRKFEIVVIDLDSPDDKPQLIFENINSTGEPLSAGDKIRNWALMLSNEEARKTVYDGYWKKIENKLTRVEKGKQVDYISEFFRTYLMCKRSEFVSDANTYPLFKELLNDEIKNDDLGSIKTFYDDVLKYLLPYLSVKFMEKVPELEAFDERIFSLKFLQVETINSFIVNLFVDFVDKKLTQEEVTKSLYIIETFIARRIICGFKSDGYNQRFPELHKTIRTKQEKNQGKTYDDCLSARMLEAKGRTVALPTDADISNSIPVLNFSSNNTNQKQYILAKICDQSKESTVLRSIFDKTIKLSIEHIMPQTMTPEWQNDLGKNWVNVHNKWLHTFANLTLTAYNSKLSNKPFSEKKTMKDGYSQSPLLVNQYIAEFDIWDEDALTKRTKWLSEQLANVWKYPKTTLLLVEEIIEDDNSYSLYDWEGEQGRKPATVTIDSDEMEVSDWKELMVVAVRYIQGNFSDEFGQLIDNKILGKKKPLITKNKETFNSPKEISHGIFIESNFSAKDIVENIKRIYEHVGYTEENCPISFTLQ